MGSPTPPAPPRTRVPPGAPPRPPWPVPMSQDIMDSVPPPVLLSPRPVVHPVPPTLWTATHVSVELMESLSVHLLCVDLPPPQLQPPPPQQQQQRQPLLPPPAPLAQCPLWIATPVSAAPWVSRCAPRPSAPPLPRHPPAPPCQALTLAVSVSSPSPSQV